MRLLIRNINPLMLLIRNLRFFKQKSEPPRNEKGLDETSSIKTDASLETAKKTIPVRILKRVPTFMTPRQVWVENFDTTEASHRGIIDLHPEIFGTRPRPDIIHENVSWQLKYRLINHAYTPAKHEINRSTRKPWQQKGTGRARHGTRRSPLFIGGVKITGPKGPVSHFYMPPHSKRVQGLCSALTVKFAQDDLHVIDNLHVPTSDPKYILDLVKTRQWGPSVLIVDVDDILPENIALATYPIKHVNVLPVYGLNVLCIMKYNTLVLTMDAVNLIEEKLLQQLYCPNPPSGKIFTSSV